jgi:hypothetical protein
MGNIERQLSLSKPLGLIWFNWDPLIPNFSARDFELTVDVTLVEAKDLADDETSILISFRNSSDNSNLYLVKFNNAGYSMVVNKNGDWSTILDSTPSDAFALYPGTTNKFGITARGSLITLYANGRELTTIEDSILSNAGGIGLGTATMSTRQTVIIEFDNVVIR